MYRLEVFRGSEPIIGRWVDTLGECREWEFHYVSKGFTVKILTP